MKSWQSEFDITDIVKLKIAVEEADITVGMVTSIQFDSHIPNYRIVWAGAGSTWHYEYELESAEDLIKK